MKREITRDASPDANTVVYGSNLRIGASEAADMALVRDRCRSGGKIPYVSALSVRLGVRIRLRSLP
jgi:hypothetical protein